MVAKNARPLGRLSPSALILLVSVFIVATCGLIYELIAGTISSYLQGNSVTQFSLVIGLFLSSMGIGSFLSKFVKNNLLRTFLVIELAVGVVGGSMALILFFAFAVLKAYMAVLIGLSLLVGTMVGLEIPLLVRIMKENDSLKTTLGNVLSLDYIGALAASLLFPLVLLPRLGLVRTSFMFGLLNVGVSLVGLHYFSDRIQGALKLKIVGILAAGLMGAGIFTSMQTTSWLEDILYQDKVVYAETTPYQRIVITKWRDDTRLFLDGNLQFSSVDEFRYHESLVHPAMAAAPSPSKVLLLGAGDGFAAKEVLKHKTVTRLDLVDLDPAMTRVFAENPVLSQLNGEALKDPRVHIYNEDALKFLEKSAERYDAIIIDLPDPNNESIGRLYTRSFYRVVANHLTRTGVMVTQATSPFYATDAYWCIANTIGATTLTRDAGSLYIAPFHVNVPSFGEWGFVMASLMPIDPQKIRIDVETRFLTNELLPTLFVFPKDIAHRDTPVNRLDNQVIIELYRSGYKRFH